MNAQASEEPRDAVKAMIGLEGAANLIGCRVCHIGDGGLTTSAGSPILEVETCSNLPLPGKKQEGNLTRQNDRNSCHLYQIRSADEPLTPLPTRSALQERIYESVLRGVNSSNHVPGTTWSA